MRVVILAGGRGTRLKSYTDKVPKPLIKINEKTILEYQIDSLKKYGLNNIIISIGYLGEKIVEYFGDGSNSGVKISYLKEEQPLGTGGVLYYLRNIVEDKFILLFGDIVLDINWDRFIDFDAKKNGIGTLLVHPNDHPYDSDLVELNKDERIVGISYKNTYRDNYENIVKSGVHIFKSEIFRYTKPFKMDLEKDIITAAIKNNEMIYGYRTSEYVKDMGSEERKRLVTRDVGNGFLERKALYSKQKCIFLDRDGTINKYKGLLYKVEDFELEYRVAEAIKMINGSGYLCVVISNQPVIARNLCSFDELRGISKKLHTLLGYEGAYLDDIFYCPHHPDKGYEGENAEFKVPCGCRKPDVGMIVAAQKKYNIDLKESYIIGDSTVDIKAGKNAGLKTVLLKTGQAGGDMKYDVKPDFVADNLFEAVLNIVTSEGKVGTNQETFWN